MPKRTDPLLRGFSMSTDQCRRYLGTETADLRSAPNVWSKAKEKRKQQLIAELPEAVRDVYREYERGGHKWTDQQYQRLCSVIDRHIH